MRETKTADGVMEVIHPWSVWTEEVETVHGDMRNDFKSDRMCCSRVI